VGKIVESMRTIPLLAHQEEFLVRDKAQDTQDITRGAVIRSLIVGLFRPKSWFEKTSV